MAITAEPLMPDPLAATLIGSAGGVIVIFSITAFDRIRIDDPVGAISVHGVVGIWGLLAVPLSNGEASLGGQLLGTLTIVTWVGAISALSWFLLDRALGLRVTREDEYRGVDVSECGLEAYPEFTGARAIFND